MLLVVKTDPPPSAPFNGKFKLMLAKTHATWEEFSSLLDEFISFSCDRVNIPKESNADYVFRQDNPDNPKFIQAFYRRNRRCAVSKVIGELAACNNTT